MKYSIRCFLLSLVLLAIYLNILTFEKALNSCCDFQWNPTRELCQHQNPYELYLANKVFLAQFPLYPVTGYIILIPYALLDWSHAKIAWTLTNYLATFMLLYGLQKLWKIDNKMIMVFLCAAFLISKPYRIGIENGQHDLVVLTLFIWSIIHSKNYKLVAGILLGLSWFKYSTTFPLSIYFIYKQEWKTVFFGVAVHVLLFIGICLWLWQSPAHIITTYFYSLKDMASYWEWHLYHQYSYIAFMIPTWWCIHFVESNYRIKGV
jgi:hypothetical protein